MSQPIWNDDLVTLIRVLADFGFEKETIANMITYCLILSRHRKKKFTYEQERIFYQAVKDLDPELFDRMQIRSIYEHVQKNTIHQ